MKLLHFGKLILLIKHVDRSFISITTMILLAVNIDQVLRTRHNIISVLTATLLRSTIIFYYIDEKLRLFPDCKLSKRSGKTRT